MKFCRVCGKDKPTDKMPGHMRSQHKQLCIKYLDKGGLFLKHKHKLILPFYLNWEQVLKDYGNVTP